MNWIFTTCLRDRRFRVVFAYNIEVMGTEGTAILEEDNLIKWQFEKATSEDEMIIKKMSGGHVSHGGVSNPADISFIGHQRQMEDMIKCIETGDKPCIDGLEGRKSVEIVLAIYKSAKTGRMVNCRNFGK